MNHLTGYLHEGSCWKVYFNINLQQGIVTVGNLNITEQGHSPQYKLIQ